MNNKRMEHLRESLNSMIVSENRDDMELLSKSQDMDKLILKSVRVDIFRREVLGEMDKKVFDTVVDKLELFEKMYEMMRIVDPLGKRVLEIKDGGLQETGFICYDFWQKGIICENCIAMRAYNENNTMIKIEAAGDGLYMVTAVPISVNGKILIVELLKNATDSMYMGNEKLSNHSSILNAYEHINQAAVRDELTGLYNRRYINEKLPVDLFSSSVGNKPISIIFADLDYFKNINDTYGHTAGDSILKDFAKLLKKHVGNETDWIARYGGEEFLICLPNTESEAARAIAEGIRKSVSENVFCYGNKKINLTCSFGVHSVCDDEECLTVDEIIEAADKKLYQAKREGRNRVV